MKKAPSPLVSLIPLVVLVIMLFATIRTLVAMHSAEVAKCPC